METSEVTHQITQAHINSQKQEEYSSPDVINRLTDFFLILLQIDKREKVTKLYDKSIN